MVDVGQRTRSSVTPQPRHQRVQYISIPLGDCDSFQKNILIESSPYETGSNMHQGRRMVALTKTRKIRVLFHESCALDNLFRQGSEYIWHEPYLVEFSLCGHEFVYFPDFPQQLVDSSVATFLIDDRLCRFRMSI